jgi:hypothetical protein
VNLNSFPPLRRLLCRSSFFLYILLLIHINERLGVGGGKKSREGWREAGC